MWRGFDQEPCGNGPIDSRSDEEEKMIVIPGRIPVAIHPFFWLIAGLIGWMNSHTLFGMLAWIGIILVSVLVHEFGHALTAVFFKQKTKIQLVALGGLPSF